MAFKFVTFCALLAAANAGFVSPVTYAAAPTVVKYANPAVDAVASTQQNVVRSFEGTVSSYSKSVNTPYSSVHKSDTRINNNVYTPTVAKTVTYAAPAVTKTVVAHAAPVVTYAAPAVAKTVVAPTVYAHAAPAIAKTVSYASPAVYTHAAPAVTKTVYAHESPVVYGQPAVTKTVSYAAPSTTYNHGPAATTYTHNAPGVSAYGTSQTVHYSPAEMVSHMSFDGFGTHWGF